MSNNFQILSSGIVDSQSFCHLQSRRKSPAFIAKFKSPRQNNGVRNSRKNEKGQVALFVALIFQVLFVFFAMIVNVGLLVHHKINLQNSTDFAAYYGAMRQAEMMNAISHVNYQIHQAYKLFMFRYNQLGNGGARYPLTDKDEPLVKPPVFCIAYDPVNAVQGTENYCKKAADTVSIPTPGVPQLFNGAFPFLNFQTAIADTANSLKQAAIKSCRDKMALNFMMLARFAAAYKLDLANRKQLLLHLANQLSLADPTDIDNQSIKQGAYKTLIKNLTYQNQDSLNSKFDSNGKGSGDSTADFQFLNSFSLPGCTGTGNDLEPPGWLSEVSIFPFLFAVDGDCSGSSSDIKFIPKAVNLGNAATIFQNASNTYGPKDMQQMALYLNEPTGEDPTTRLYKSSLGFEKNPWCVAYVGVSAKATPQIPFSPLGSVTLTAKSFAKPFGGRVGPWYGTTWQGSATQSEKAIRNDNAAPLRVDFGTIQIDPNDAATQKALRGSYSRYMGDKVGILSNITTAQMRNAIATMKGGIDLNWYEALGKEDYNDKNSSGDPLAWNQANANIPPPLRNLEIAAIAPDQFDASFYSVDPDYYNNYMQRLQKGYGDQLQFAIRGDLGSRNTGTTDIVRFSVRNQIDTLKNQQLVSIDYQSKLTYYLTDFAQLLTGWNQSSPDNYSMDPTRFGQCPDGLKVNQDDPATFFTPGSCKAGGRVGYSVKLVDGKYLANQPNGKAAQYELGGASVSGTIKNPPPTTF